MSGTFDLPSMKQFRATCRKLDLDEDQAKALASVIWQVHLRLACGSEQAMAPAGRKEILKKLKSFNSSLDALLLALGVTAMDIESYKLPLDNETEIGKKVTSRLMVAAAGREMLKKDTAAKLVPFVTLGVSGLGDDLIRVKRDIDLVVDVTVKDRGGQPPDLARNHLLGALCKASKRIIGRPPASTAGGPFYRLVQEVVVECCGLPEDGLEKLIDRSVSSFKKST